jgi:alkylhydroperoxidase/carboxymuconolactone decarboxylase family protein YurZ
VHASGHFTRLHIKSAFKAGATVGEIMEILKVGVVQGVRSCNLAVSILAEELEREAASRHAAA